MEDKNNSRRGKRTSKTSRRSSVIRNGGNSEKSRPSSHSYQSISHEPSKKTEYKTNDAVREQRSAKNQRKNSVQSIKSSSAYSTGQKIKNIITIQGTRIRRGAFDYQFLLTTIVLIAFGMIMLYSASSSRAYAANEDSMFFMKKQFGGACIGFVLMIGCMFIDYHILAKLSYWFYGIVIGLLILVIVPGVGTTSNGATRWLFGFQPSEFMKCAMILVTAQWMASNQKYLPKLIRGFCPLVLMLGAVCILLMLEPHFSATLLIFSTTMLMMFVGGSKIKHFIYLAIPAVAVGIVAIIAEPYRMQRLLSFGDPFADKQGSGWQIVQSLYAIGSGGVFGVGFGKSRQKFMSLPEPHNDFIFSVICEELGWVGAIIVIALFIYLIYRGTVIAMKAPDILGKVIVVGVIGIIGIQAFINIGVVTASIPVTGMPLPFFSYGGTALMMTMAEIGLVLNVSRQEKV